MKINDDLSPPYLSPLPKWQGGRRLVSFRYTQFSHPADAVVMILEGQTISCLYTETDAFRPQAILNPKKKISSIHIWPLTGNFLAKYQNVYSGREIVPTRERR